MIRVQNIYHMLAYAYQVLNEAGYRQFAERSFDDAMDLYAAILTKGVIMQIKRGLGREYVEQTDSLSVLRGRIDISESIRTRATMRRQLVCTYDEFSVDSYMNQILKSTMELLLRADIDSKIKLDLRKALEYFYDVQTIDVCSIRWNMQYNRNNETYRMLMAICYLVIENLLPTRADGTMRFMDFDDEAHMSHLYEKFLLNYFTARFPNLNVTSSQIDWALDDDARDLLPTMQSDIMVRDDEKVLIIDAKYYAQALQYLYNVPKQRSDNMYQIFAYVKNMEANLLAADIKNETHADPSKHRVYGMLLYAATDEKVKADAEYHMSGNQISVRTIDLDCEWEQVTAQLDTVVTDYFAVEGKK